MSKNNHRPSIAPLVRSGAYLLIGAAAAILMVFLLFMYQNFYLTLASAGEILILKADLAVETLDETLIEKTEALNQRRVSRQRLDWQKIRDPFHP